MLAVLQVAWEVPVRYRSRASRRSTELRQQEQALGLLEVVAAVEQAQVVTAMPILMVFRNQAPLPR